MKVIDLLNKKANGEELPKKIKYNDEIWEYYKGLGDYISAGNPNTLFTMDYIHQILNDEIKIIEEDKKIEKLDCVNKKDGYSTIDFDMVQDKINELIDEINKLKDGNDDR